MFELVQIVQHKLALNVFMLSKALVVAAILL